MNLWYNVFPPSIFSVHLFTLSRHLSLCSSSAEDITVPLHNEYKEELMTKMKNPSLLLQILIYTNLWNGKYVALHICAQTAF
jgi:hypothetical protein